TIEIISQTESRMIMIKKLLRAGILSLIIILVAFVTYYFWPKQYDFTLPGVIYQLGEENVDYSVHTSIVVEGTLTRSLTGDRTFRGKIEIVDDSMYDSEKVKLIDLKFFRNTNNSALIQYQNVGKFLQTSALGTIYINNDFSKMAITRFVDIEGTHSQTWSGNDGFMFAAPATTRDE